MSAVRIQQGIRALLLSVIVSVAAAAMVVATNPWLGNIGFEAIYITVQLLFLVGIFVVETKKQ